MLRSDATNLINAVVALRNGADDQTAARNVVAFPAWAAGKSYAVGERVKDEGKLYKVDSAYFTDGLEAEKHAFALCGNSARSGRNGYRRVGAAGKHKPLYERGQG